MALSKELRDKMTSEVSDCLAERPIPIRMLDWRSRSYLEGMDDRELLQCWMDTREFRLNPTESTDFLEEGISAAERQARLRLFTYSAQVNSLREMFIELAEKTFVQAELDQSAKGLQEASRELIKILAKSISDMHDRVKEAPKERGRSGGIKAGEHWKAVADEAVRLARERGLDGGAFSAEYIAGMIEHEVRDFARKRGRDFPGFSAVRKIAEYLRHAGIKKRPNAP